MVQRASDNPPLDHGQTHVGRYLASLNWNFNQGWNLTFIHDCALELLSAHLEWASSSVVPIIIYLKLQQKEYGRYKIDLKGWRGSPLLSPYMWSLGPPSKVGSSSYRVCLSQQEAKRERLHCETWRAGNSKFKDKICLGSWFRPLVVLTSNEAAVESGVFMTSSQNKLISWHRNAKTTFKTKSFNLKRERVRKYRESVSNFSKLSTSRSFKWIVVSCVAPRSSLINKKKGNYYFMQLLIGVCLKGEYEMPGKLEY